MEKELVQEALDVLRQYNTSGSDMNCDDELVYELAKVLNGYDISRSRKITILACSILISKAIRKHRELSTDSNDRLARSILDGDYLLGLYYRLAAGRREWKLIMHLNLFNKKVQLALMQGRPAGILLADLKHEIRSYLDRQIA